MNRLVFQVAVFSSLCLVGCRSTADLKVVSDFEVDRYLGKWYEAARFPHRFEKGLVGVTAEYNRNPNGTIKVVNRGFNPKKEAWKQAEAVARFKGEQDQGWLRVSFFRPFYADYKILQLDDAYTEAIVAGPSYGYLWILVRDPAIPRERLDRLIQDAASFGFDTNRLEIIDQSMNL